MEFIELIKSILSNGKKNARFYSKTLEKNIGDPTPLKVGLYDGETPITNEEIGIEINGRQYIKTTDENGIATLNINLSVGKYTAKIYWRGINGKYNSVTAYTEVIVNPAPEPEPVQPSGNKKPIILGCDANTEDDSTVQNRIAERLEQEGYNVEKLPIGPNYFASTDYSSKAKNKIGIYLIASGIFSIADAYYGSGQFDNYIFGIRGDFGDRGATCFNCPISADADCTSICDELDGKTFNQMNAMLQPYVAICGGGSTDELADNIIDWLNGLDNIEPESQPDAEPEEEPEEKTYSQEILEYFESKFGEMSCIDDCLEAIQGNGYGYYYDDAYTNYTSINRMANGSGVNCTDSCHVFWHLAVALGYRVEVLHIQCSGGDGHVRLELEREGTGTFYRDPAAVLDGEDISYNWCSSGYTIAVNPDWFFENLYR